MRVNKWRLFKVIGKNEEGFTLIEMLLVLYIVLLTSSLSVHAISGISEKRSVDQFFQQLMLDVQSAQATAIEKKSTVTIRFLSNKVEASVAAEGAVIFEYEFPENITFIQLSNLKTIIINANGNIRDFGRLKFNTPFGQIHLILNIQEGRMRLSEQ